MTTERKQVLEKPVVLYDAECRMCTTAADQLRQLDRDHKLEWQDVNDAAQHRRFPKIDWNRAQEEIHLIHTDGRVRTGSRAVRDIAELIGGEVGRTAAQAMDLPGLREASDLMYHIISENRHRITPKKAC